MSDFEGNRSLLNSKTVLFNVNRLYMYMNVTCQCTLALKNWICTRKTQFSTLMCYTVIHLQTYKYLYENFMHGIVDIA